MFVVVAIVAAVDDSDDDNDDDVGDDARFVASFLLVWNVVGQTEKEETGGVAMVQSNMNISTDSRTGFALVRKPSDLAVCRFVIVVLVCVILCRWIVRKMSATSPRRRRRTNLPTEREKNRQ